MDSSAASVSSRKDSRHLSEHSRQDSTHDKELSPYLLTRSYIRSAEATAKTQQQERRQKIRSLESDERNEKIKKEKEKQKIARKISQFKLQINSSLAGMSSNSRSRPSIVLPLEHKDSASKQATTRERSRSCYAKSSDIGDDRYKTAMHVADGRQLHMTADKIILPSIGYGSTLTIKTVEELSIGEADVDPIHLRRSPINTDCTEMDDQQNKSQGSRSVCTSNEKFKVI